MTAPASGKPNVAAIDRDPGHRKAAVSSSVPKFIKHCDPLAASAARTLVQKSCAFGAICMNAFHLSRRSAVVCRRCVSPRAHSVALAILRHAADGLLVSGGHEPHITNMTPRENPQSNASCHAAAPNKEGSKTGRSKRMDQSLAEEEHILDCLGAAVMMRWGTLPTKIQRELFDYATSLADLTHTAQLRGQIARYLHNHKDEGARTTRTMPRQDVT